MCGWRRMRMAKPRRKNPGLNVAEASPQGEVFVSILMSFLGEEVWWKALEQTRDKSIIFLIGGSRGCGVLVEGPDCAEEDRWVHRWGFRYNPADLAIIVQMDFTAQRWDPWLNADTTGDMSLIDGPASRRHRVQQQRDWQIGQERDRLQMTVLPEDTAPSTLCGIPMAQIDEVLERNAKKAGDGGHEVGMIRRAGETTETELLLGGDFPIVD